ncbi:MAG TPA: hypothetical protein VIQ22_02135 [Gammaproteobacteria bacterium]
MAIFMLHFDSCASGAAEAHVTADACAITDTLEDAEALARKAIDARGYHVDHLIVYSRLEKSQLAGLREYETLLYLKALKRKPSVAVMFS